MSDTHAPTLGMVPCASCGTREGPRDGGFLPVRITGRRFGYAGVLCKTCYQRLDRQGRFTLRKERRHAQH